MVFKVQRCLVLLLLWCTAAASGDSVRELLKLMQQEAALASHKQQFMADVELWAQALEQLSLQFVQFVEHCRRRRSRCEERHVLRQLRGLRRMYGEMRARLAKLEQRYAGSGSEQHVLQPTLLAVDQVLRLYYETLRLVTAQTYKLVQQ